MLESEMKAVIRRKCYNETFYRASGVCVRGDIHKFKKKEKKKTKAGGRQAIFNSSKIINVKEGNVIRVRFLAQP